MNGGFLAGFLYEGGTFSWLSYPGAAFTFPYGINDKGVIVGSYADKYLNHISGFVYSGGTFTTLDFPGETRTTLLGINNFGQIVGQYQDLGNHSFIYSGGVFTTLDNPGWTYTYATGINNLGQVVGFYSPVPTPEPSSLCLTCSGLFAMFGIISRRSSPASFMKALEVAFGSARLR